MYLPACHRASVADGLNAMKSSLTVVESKTLLSCPFVRILPAESRSCRRSWRGQGLKCCWPPLRNKRACSLGIQPCRHKILKVATWCTQCTSHFERNLLTGGKEGIVDGRHSRCSTTSHRKWSGTCQTRAVKRCVATAGKSNRPPRYKDSPS